MHQSPSQILDGLASQVQYEDDSEETLYETSEALDWDRQAFSTLREAFLYRANRIVGEIARTWAPLGDPLDAGRVAAWGERDEEYETLLLALFRRRPFVAYLAVREFKRRPEQFALFLGVGVSGDGEPQAGNGEGDEGRVWLSLPPARK